MLPRKSSSEMGRPGDTEAAVAVSTERLKQRLQQEGLSEAAIADSERIVRAEFEALQKQEILSEESPQDWEDMEASFIFDETSLNEWRNYLCDINFWLDGYLNTPAYEDLEEKLYIFRYVQWNVGVGATACFARAISSIARDAIIRIHGPFDPVIEVDMKHAAVVGTSLGVNGRLAIKVAQQLGLLDQEDYYYRWCKLKADGEELWYYTYGLQNATVSLEGLARPLAFQIFKILSTKTYLAVVENLDEPIDTNTMPESHYLGRLLGRLLFCLPPPLLKHSCWFMSATSKDIYNNSSKPTYNCLIGPSSGEDMVILTLYSLHQAAKYILGTIGGHKDDEQYWHHVAVRCFHYAIMLLVPHCRHSSSSHHGDDGDQQQSSAAGLVDDIITSDELILQWSAQRLLVIDKERMGETAGTSSDGNYSDIYQVGNVILEAFREYSLLPQLPFSLSPAMTEKADEEATKSVAHFLACHNLILEHHTTGELCDRDHPRLESMQWILHVGDGDQGWHLSREWLRSDKASSGPTTLILRHCSQQSRLLAMLDQLLAKLPFLCVLDLSYSSIESLPPSVSCLQILQLLYLSYTPLKSLPPSIFYLQKLQFLSLRGCFNMVSPFDFFLDTTDITTPQLPENNSKTEITSLLHLDLSNSNVKNFHSAFFRRMPNLQELLLLNCSNLEELPPSTANLSSLEKLELRGTQIKSFPPGKIFEDMKKLGSVKIIENKELLFAPTGLFSKASGLTDLHIEGCESITEVEVNLERHPTLRSFSFSGAPHTKRLSLGGCRKLEYVNIKEVGALEELDLSATAIKELPESIPNLPQLRRLLLMGVPSLRRFPWHMLQRLPEVFCLDQCSSDKVTINHSDHPQVTHQVCIISDSRLFYSFNAATKDLVRAGKLLKTFYVQVTSCKATTSRKMQDGQDMVTTKTLEVAPATYANVNHRYMTDRVSVVSMDDIPPFQETARHVEISADRYPHGLKQLLEVTKSISMWDDTHISRLSDLSADMDELEECKLRWCHKMVLVFRYKIPNLKNAYVSHLKILTHFHAPWSISTGFNYLKHLVLEDCSRLEGVLHRDCELRSLETLDILFCYNLKAIFHDDYYYPSYRKNNYRLPCLRRIRLQELPLLKHLHVDNPILTAPAWEELHVRGCWSLRRLPRFSRQQPDKKKAAVKVSGERAWWDKLSWDQDDDGTDSHRGSYEPRLPPALASRRERVVIKSYLR